MHLRHCLLLVLLFGVSAAHAQYFKISGKITNDKLESLALVSIQVKGSVKEYCSGNGGGKKSFRSSCKRKNERPLRGDPSECDKA